MKSKRRNKTDWNPNNGKNHYYRKEAGTLKNMHCPILRTYIARPRMPRG